MTPTVETGVVPDGSTRSAIRRLADAIERADGAPPLSDQARTLLGSDTVSHLIARDSGDSGDSGGSADLVGYAQVDGSSLELATSLAAAPALLDAAPNDVLVWSHGRGSRLLPFFEGRGFARVRELYQLRRPAGDLPPAPALAEGVLVRAFEPGVDDAAWLRLNAAAFAAHAEQGRWQQTDLDARESEDWFDPAGFLLAERDGQLLGFHWTKVHPPAADDDPRLGEVYVLGVSPDAQGLGLGRALLIRGLQWLVEHGCAQLMLYVDGDNPRAVRLYERDGFSEYDLDVQWRAPA